MRNRYDAPYDIEDAVKADPEIRFLVNRIEELKAQQSSAMPAPFDFSDEAAQRRYNDFFLQLQINALESYIENKSLEARR